MTPTSSPSSQRVSYRNGILLDASDFQQEQSYHRSRLALALSLLHGHGTVAGLRVEYSPAGAVDPATGEPEPPEQLIVHPGVALDRAGRLIEVTSKQCLRLNRWFDFQVAQPDAALKPFVSGGQRSFIADLFLRFKECPQGLRPGFPEPAADASDAIVPARTNDSFDLQLVARDCDPENTLPPVPARRHSVVPANRAALLASIYGSYPAAGAATGQEYPPDFADTTAVFLCRVRIRLVNSPAGSLARHATNAVTVDDLDRPLVVPGDLLRLLLPA